jgi:hypothetical protein
MCSPTGLFLFDAANVALVIGHNLRRVLALAEGFAAHNAARPMLGFRPHSGSQTGFLTDDFLFAARAKVVANVLGSTERTIKANEEVVGPIAAKTVSFPKTSLAS